MSQNRRFCVESDKILGGTLSTVSEIARIQLSAKSAPAYAEAAKACNAYFKSIRRGHSKFREMRRRVRSIKELLEAEAQEKAEAAKCKTTCEGRACGDDGCGGQCGTCPEGQTCSPEGACVEPGGD